MRDDQADGRTGQARPYLSVALLSVSNHELQARVFNGTALEAIEVRAAHHDDLDAHSFELGHDLNGKPGDGILDFVQVDELKGAENSPSCVAGCLDEEIEPGRRRDRGRVADVGGGERRHDARNVVVRAHGILVEDANADRRKERGGRERRLEADGLVPGGEVVVMRDDLAPLGRLAVEADLEVRVERQSLSDGGKVGAREDVAAELVIGSLAIGREPLGFFRPFGLHLLKGGKGRGRRLYVGGAPEAANLEQDGAGKSPAPEQIDSLVLPQS